MIFIYSITWINHISYLRIDINPHIKLKCYMLLNTNFAWIVQHTFKSKDYCIITDVHIYKIFLRFLLNYASSIFYTFKFYHHVLCRINFEASESTTWLLRRRLIIILIRWTRTFEECHTTVTKLHEVIKLDQHKRFKNAIIGVILRNSKVDVIHQT